MVAQANRQVDVAVVGSGPSGMIAALMLARHGVSTALVGPKAKPDGRTTALLDASVRILADIGVWDALTARAAPLRQMRIIDDTGRLVRAPETLFDSAEIDLDAFGYNVLNIDLNAALEAAVAASGIDRVEAFVTDIEPGEAAVALTTAGAGTLSATLVVAADGRESRVREAAGIDVRRWTYPQSALVANLGHDRPHHDASTEFHTPHGPFTLVPLAGGRSSLVWVGQPDEIDRIAALDDDAFSRAAETQAKSFLGAMRVEGPRHVYPLSGLRAATVAARRIALVGEAAHVFPPIGAQGLNLSLRDVAALGETVAQARDSGLDIGGETALGRYRDARKADIATRLYGVDTLNRTLLADFLPVQVARSLGLYLAGRLAPLRRAMMREGVSPRLTRFLPLR